MTSLPGPDGLRRVLIDHIAATYGHAVTSDTSLFYSGMIDSLGIADLALVIGRALGRPFAGGDIVTHDLDSIARMVAFCYPETGAAAPASARAGLPNEEVFTVTAPGMAPGNPGLAIRAYLQLPEGGWNPDGRLVVLLHGLGGLPHDLVYKSARQTLARAGHAALGVDFRGAEWFRSDVDYIHGQLLPVIAGILSQPTMRSHLLASTDDSAAIELPRQVYAVLPTRASEAELARPWPDRCFDQGAYQALDVLSCLDALRRRFGSLPRTYLCAQSAGMQVALGCARFAPTDFDGIFELGGSYCVAAERVRMRELLCDSSSYSTHQQGMTFDIDRRHFKLAISVMCHLPVACPEGRCSGSASVEDEVQLRLVDTDPGWMAAIGSDFRYDAVAGAEDENMRVSYRSAFQLWCVSHGLDAGLRLVTAPEVDHEIFTGTGHTCFGRLDRVVEALVLPWLEQRPAGARPRAGDLGTTGERFINGCNGRWSVQFSPTPHLVFLPGWR